LVSVESGSIRWLAYPKLKALEKRIRAFFKKFDYDLLAIFFEGVWSKIRNVGRNGTIEAQLIFLSYKENILVF